MELTNYTYGLVPKRRHRKKRIYKKWLQRYGLKVEVTKKEKIKVNPLKEDIFKSFKDKKPLDPSDLFWSQYGFINEEGNWHWDLTILLGPMVTLIEIKNRLFTELSD